MTNQSPRFDHIGVWCTDLAESAARFETATGVASKKGGRHEGQGTWNRLVGAGRDQYVELIALDRTQTTHGLIAERSASLPDLTPCLLAFRSAELEVLTRKAREAGCETPGPFSMQRAGSDGTPIHWRVLFLTHFDFPLLPFFIDWQDTPHPSASLGDGVSIGGISLSGPQPDRLSGLLNQLGLEIETRYSDKPALHAAISGPGGALSL